MSKTVSVVVTDDIDGSTGAETVAFSFEGQGYEIDLAPENQAKMKASFAPFMEAGRRLAQRRPVRSTRSRSDLSAVRKWAQDQGMAVAERGRISADVLTQYDAAH
jgi:Lsr2